MRIMQNAIRPRCFGSTVMQGPERRFRDSAQDRPYGPGNFGIHAGIIAELVLPVRWS
ncbi:Hypothetical protein GbCGDNIH4_7120 [Granulibacter bethesdensis CGDNIH4]|nr:Hypothetical protein GbCGDNIH4_7120 [Granulibacter bethesdensis CGDNIH4]